VEAIVIYGYGPQDKDDQLTPLGELNTEAGIELFHHKGGRVILTGGQTGKSCFSEAEVMQRWLIHRGVPKGCIIPEIKARNTIANVVFVANIVDMMSFDHLIHIALKHHLPRIGELCFLIGIDEISEYCPSQEVLGESHSLVKKAEKEMGVHARDEKRWMRGLHEIPEYWLPQAVQIESLERFRYILGHQRIQRWVEENFFVSHVSGLTDREIEEIREKIKMMEKGDALKGDDRKSPPFLFFYL